MDAGLIASNASATSWILRTSEAVAAMLSAKRLLRYGNKCYERGRAVEDVEGPEPRPELEETRICD